jgi:hypothetical protein
MSVAFTEDAVVERRKTVTRRKGWWLNKTGDRLLLPGNTLTLCRKVMGRKPGEPLVRLAEVEVIDVRREPLNLLLDSDAYGQQEMTLEGFDGMPPATFLWRYFIDEQGMSADSVVTRIEWRYLDTSTEGNPS